MGGIFCLETEWKQSIHDLKEQSKVLPLLEYLKRVNNTQYVFRQVATIHDFDYYITHLLYDSYSNYNTVYLCFHGYVSNIAFADKNNISLQDIGEKYTSIFEGKKVHFGSCSTLHITEKEAMQFKANTKAKLLTGYAREVPFVESFLFELWLINILANHKGIGPLKLKYKAEKEMYFLYNKLKFQIF